MSYNDILSTPRYFLNTFIKHKNEMEENKINEMNQMQRMLSQLMPMNRKR